MHLECGRIKSGFSYKIHLKLTNLCHCAPASPVACLILCSRMSERIKRAKARGRGKCLVVHFVSEGGGGKQSPAAGRLVPSQSSSHGCFGETFDQLGSAVPLRRLAHHSTTAVQQKLNTGVLSALFGSQI